jgi:hypothetical protein
MAKPANEIENHCGPQSARARGNRGENKLMPISRNAVLENVRRYRAIASLYRQTAAFRPLQRCSLLVQASEWECRALTELESYFMADKIGHDKQPEIDPYAYAPWATMAAA